MNDNSYPECADAADTPGRSSWAAPVAWVLLAVFLAGFVLPPSRLSRVFGTGSVGAGSANTGLYCRSYHRAPIAPEGILPTFHRAPDGAARVENVYVSNFPTVYLVYGLATALIGTSEAALRSVAIAFALLGAWLAGRLAQAAAARRGGAKPEELAWVYPACVCLFMSSPLAIPFGVKAEIVLPIGIGLLLALDGYDRWTMGRCGMIRLVLSCLPLATMTSFLYPFFGVGIFVAEWVRTGRFRSALRTVIPVAAPWIVFFLLHLALVSYTLGGLDLFLSRAMHRSVGGALSGMSSPLRRLGEMWLERFGTPHLLLLLVAGVLALRQRRADQARGAVVIAFAVTVGLQCGILLEMMAEHKDALLLFLPAGAYLAAPTLVRGWRERGWRRGMCALMLLGCFGLFGHKVQKEIAGGPDSFEREFAATCSAAGKASGEEGRGLLVAAIPSYGVRMAGMYYSRLDLDMIDTQAAKSVDVGQYPVVIGVNAWETPESFKRFSGKTFREEGKLEPWFFWGTFSEK